METEGPLEEDRRDDDQSGQSDQQAWPLGSRARPWRSAPPSPPPSRDHHPASTPHSASLLSLQTEIFLDLVAEAQSKRLEEQRAEFEGAATAPARARPPEEKEQLYSTILSHQCQRIETQRSEPPLPPGGHELLELLLRVQGGGRMEEQRSRLPGTLQAPPAFLLRDPYSPQSPPSSPRGAPADSPPIQP
ncbi:G-protein-signaling modulator 3 [Ornithorhynchus anatinus]|uniref:G-protein-signaling modulator 3 n=1 Tax=Ornithorhynchus anatinus TaxID=9258 RepID=UPI0010A8FFF4|nr:G-protein-signaling modulator 3 [Ornithorhynchus anatinus]